MQFLLVGAGGFCGAVLRYGVMRLLAAHAGTFPFATLTVNILGSLAAGFFSTWIFQRSVFEGEWRLAVQVGLLGAFTTFSTFSLETVSLVEQGHVAKAVISVGLNLTLCLAAAALGVVLARSLP
ncbi:fluoride efflux transporter CrcB [Granulosicoccaceae sp. 1_MG-2023]|nr:fluoride efflux transporter CrcB [Granulosicoccaceae sp. 1_MG-2023]